MASTSHRGSKLVTVAGCALLVAAAGCTAQTPPPETRTVLSTTTATLVQATTETLLSTSIVTSTDTATVTATTTLVPTATVTTTATPVMDIAGPATGPPCPAAPQYQNEEPTGLDADVIAAWDIAVSTAADAGIVLCLSDGKRSRTQQQEIYDDYLRRYGKQSADELVLPPDKSSHVTGFAIDVQPAAAHTWLEGTAGALGFCRIYDNESWHFEYRHAYQVGGCPDRLPEPVR